MVHTCDPEHEDEDQYRPKFTCSICNKTFGTIWQLHDHFDKCSQDDSFIYFKKYKIVFPLSSLWAFITLRDFSTIKEFSLNSEPNGISGNHQANIGKLLTESCRRYSSTDQLSHETHDGKEYKNDLSDINDLEPLIGDKDKNVTCSLRLTKSTIRKKEGQKRGKKNVRKAKIELIKPIRVKQRKSNRLIVRTGIQTRYSIRKCLNKVDDKDQHAEEFTEIKVHSEDSSITNCEETVIDDRPKIGKAKHMTGKLSQKTEHANGSLVAEPEVECSDLTSNNKSPSNQQYSKSCESTEPEERVESAQVPGSITTMTNTSTSITGKEKTDILMLDFKTKKPGRKKGSSKLQMPKKPQTSRNGVESKFSDTREAQNQQTTESENSPIKKKLGRKKQDLDVCTICGKKMKRIKMKVHMISHSDVRPYKCKFCPKTYKYPDHLAVHVKSHLDVLPYYCEVCGQGFIEANRLKRHSIMHTDFRPYRCEKCNAGFVTKYKLDRHMSVHTGVKKLQCDFCGLRFTHKETLTQHILGIHKKERRFSCQDCNETFFTNYQLKCHALKHSGLRPHKCTMCKSDFIERKELRRHMRKKHNVVLDCKSESGAPDPMEVNQSVNKESPTSLPKQSSANNESLSTNLPDVIGLNVKLEEHRGNELIELPLYRANKIIDQEKYMYGVAETHKVGFDESKVNSITDSNSMNSLKSNQDNNSIFTPFLNRNDHLTFVENERYSQCNSAHMGARLPGGMLQSDQIINTSTHAVIDDRNFNRQNEVHHADQSSDSLSPDHCKSFLSL